MVAQDTGSAIVGPARADIYFGAGADAGRVSGRLRHNVRFVILIPKTLDPVARGHAMPLPEARPSEKIAKLFPQKQPKDASKPSESSAVSTAKGTPSDAKGGTQAQVAQAAAVVPLPEARPKLEPSRQMRRHRTHRRYRSMR
jgi:membrane-bound lytic murein transglycosylase A